MFLTKFEEKIKTHILCSVTFFFSKIVPFNRLNADLNTIRHMLALLGAHHILHVSRIRVKR